MNVISSIQLHLNTKNQKIMRNVDMLYYIYNIIYLYILYISIICSTNSILNLIIIINIEMII